MWVHTAPPAWADFYKEKAPVIAFNEEPDPVQLLSDHPALSLHGRSAGMILVPPEQLFCAWLSLRSAAPSPTPRIFPASALQPAAHNPVLRVTLALVMVE